MAVTRQPVIVKRPALRGTPVSITCTGTIKIGRLTMQPSHCTVRQPDSTA